MNLAQKTKTFSLKGKKVWEFGTNSQLSRSFFAKKASRDKELGTSQLPLNTKFAYSDTQIHSTHRGKRYVVRVGKNP